MSAEIVQLKPSVEGQIGRLARACSNKIEGTRVISFALLERKLGKRAVMVWAVLLGHRNASTALCWPSGGRIRDFVRAWFGEIVSANQLRAALHRLRQVGLVVDRGRHCRTYVDGLPHSDPYRNVKRYVRQVLGGVTRQDGRTAARVPARVEGRLALTDGWGGPRTGAGRPPKGGERGSPSAEIKIAQVGSDRGNQDCSRNKASIPNRSRLLLSEEARAVPAPFLSTGGGGSAPDEAARSPEARDEKKSLDELLRGGSGGGDPPGYFPGQDGVPPFPGAAIFAWEEDERGAWRKVCQPATIPAARPFSAEQLLDEDFVLGRMRRAYLGASGLPLRRMRPGEHGEDRMLELARQLTDLGVSPEAWFLFSDAQWRSAVGGRKAPMPLVHALSERRLAKHVGWLLADAGSYAGRREVWTRTHDLMDAAWSRMMFDLQQVSRPRTPEGIKSVVERHFPGYPGGEWRRLVLAARAEAVEAQRKIDEQVRGGRFVWGRRPAR